jgi:hypothetical protein
MITTRLAGIILYIYIFIWSSRFRRKDKVLLLIGRFQPSLGTEWKEPQTQIPAKAGISLIFPIACHSHEALSFRRKPVIPTKPCHSHETLSFRQSLSFPRSLVIPTKPCHSGESLSFPRKPVIPAKACHSGESLSFRRKPVIPTKACHSHESLSFRRKPEQVLFIPLNPADYILRFCTIMHNCH